MHQGQAPRQRSAASAAHVTSLIYALPPRALSGMCTFFWYLFHNMYGSPDRWTIEQTIQDTSQPGFSEAVVKRGQAALTAHGEIGPLIHVDHSRMSDLAAGLSKIQGLKVQRPVQSNIAFVNLDERIDVKWMVAEMKKKDVVLIPWVGNSLRLVTHHEINQPAVAKVLRCFEELCAQALEPVRA